jgi:hypothetical protein
MGFLSSLLLLVFMIYSFWIGTNTIGCFSNIPLLSALSCFAEWGCFWIVFLVVCALIVWFFETNHNGYLNLPNGRTISWSISNFNTPIYPITGIINRVIVGNSKEKLFVLFLEYDLVSKARVIAYLKKLNKIVPFHKAYLINSRPGSKDRWHIIIPEVFSQGDWLTALMESGCDDSYKSMSMKRGYSVLRISKKKNIPEPEYAQTIAFPKPKKMRLLSSWHKAYIEKACDLKLQGAALKCSSEIIGYRTGHF